MGVHIEDLNEHLHVLLKQEASLGYQSDDYLSIVVRPMHLDDHSNSSQSTDDQNPHHHYASSSSLTPNHGGWKMTTRGRWQMGQWFYNIIGDFNFPQEFAMVAMDFVDRYLSRVTPFPNSKDEVQLLGLTSFYLAVKLFQAGPVLSTTQMEIISGGAFSAKQVTAMEQELLFVLEWSLHPPCSADFLRSFFLIFLSHRCLPTTIRHEDVVNLALKMLHAAVLDYFFVAHSLPSSHMAAAALINSLEFLDNYSSHSTPSFVPSVKDLLLILDQHAGIQLDEGQVSLCRQRLWTIQVPPAADQGASMCGVSSSPANSFQPLQRRDGSRHPDQTDSTLLSPLGTRRNTPSPRPSPTSVQMMSGAASDLASFNHQCHQHQHPSETNMVI